MQIYIFNALRFNSSSSTRSISLEDNKWVFLGSW